MQVGAEEAFKLAASCDDAVDPLADVPVGVVPLLGSSGGVVDCVAVGQHAP